MSYEYFAPVASATYNSSAAPFIVLDTQVLYVGQSIELVNIGGLIIQGSQGSEIDIDGTVSTMATSGALTVGEHGTIGGNRFGARANGLGTGVVTNYGHIQGASAGIEQITYSFERIFNVGLIESGQLDDSDGHFAFNAAIYIDTSDPTSLVNDGTIRANKLDGYSFYSPKDSADKIFNSGTMIGAIGLGAGADKYDGHAGHHFGLATDAPYTFSSIDGGAGNDTIYGGADADSIGGGNDNDIIRGGAGKDTMDGGAGTDILDYTDKTQKVQVTLNGTHAASVLVNGIAEDSITNFERLYGGSAGDRFTGDSSSNLIYGNAGNDTISGGAGNDTVRGGVGRDTLDGGANTDTLDYSDKTSGITVRLTGATAATVKVGTASEDSVKNFEDVIGGSGADRITGDGGANSFRGGAGKDVMDGGAGSDTADYSDKTQKVTVTLNGATTATVFINGTAAANHEDSIKNFERVIGGSAGDKLTGDGLSNVLTGNFGNDTLSGGSGNDTLIGGLGQDSMTGGSGADHFRFAWTADIGGADIITDFAHGTDRIEIDDVTAVAHQIDLANFGYSGTGYGDGTDLFVYNPANGTLFYDATPGTPGGELLIAILLNHPATFSAADIWEI